MSKDKLVPKLRFSEFDDEWDLQKFKDNLDIKSGKGFKAAEYVNLGIPLIKIDNVSYGKITWETRDYLPNQYLETYPELILRKNDIVLALNRPITNNNLKIAKLTDKDELSILYQRVGKIFIDENNLDREFVFHLLNKEVFNFVLKNSVGSDQPFISTNKLKELELKVPHLKEQQKIGNFLHLINNKLGLLEDKHKLFLDFKKYLMQQIFTQKLRFDFTDEWQEHSFKELLKEVNEKTTINNQYEILSSTKEGIYAQKEYFADRNVASKDNTGYKILRKNQIVLSPQNLWMGNINVNTEFEIGIVSPSYKIYETTDLIKIDYFKHIIKLPRLVYEYKCASEQGASIVRRNLNKQLFDEIQIEIPSINEQKKIGNMLNLFDKKIIETKNQINESKEFKKGLLQQMFV